MHILARDSAMAGRLLEGRTACCRFAALIVVLAVGGGAVAISGCGAGNDIHSAVKGGKRAA